MCVYVCVRACHLSLSAVYALCPAWLLYIPCLGEFACLVVMADCVTDGVADSGVAIWIFVDIVCVLMIIKIYTSRNTWSLEVIYYIAMWCCRCRNKAYTLEPCISIIR